MAFLMNIVNWLRQLVGLIFPVFAKAKDWPGLTTGVRWAVRIVLFAAILVVLWYLNGYLKVNEKLHKTPPSLQWMREYWLPIFFVMVCLLIWLAWWLWKLLWQEEEASLFPDIDEAWDHAVSTLREAGIDLGDEPLFLILGRPAGDEKAEEALFNAAQIKLTVRQTPRGRAPLHVYACRERDGAGIYVTCPGACLLGRQVDLFEAEAPGGEGGAGEPADDPEWMYKTQKPTKEAAAMVTLGVKKAQGQALTPAEEEMLRAMTSKKRKVHLTDAAEIATGTARLKHLCKLIVRDRRPLCPINGLLVLIPVNASDCEDDAAVIGGLCQRDLEAARAALQLEFPVFALVCDMEQVTGFKEFVKNFSADQRLARVGQRVPLALAKEDAEVPATLGAVVHGICSSTFPSWIYKKFRLDKPGQEQPADAVEANKWLFYLLYQMRERDRYLARIFSGGFTPPKGGDLYRVGGIYLAGTGPEEKVQAFVAGVFRRLPEKQSVVEWSPNARAEDAAYERWARLGYGALVAYVAVCLAVVIYVYWLAG